jgi:hypothetical protein
VRLHRPARDRGLAEAAELCDFEKQLERGRMHGQGSDEGIRIKHI